MRKFYSLLFALLAVCGLAQAQTTVTFDATVTKGNNTTASGADEVSLDGITISTTSGGLGTGSQYRFAKNSVTTFSSTVGNIVSIEFTCTANGTSQYGPGCFAEQDGYSYDGKIGTWTGSAESVEFTASGAQVRATQIVVTVGETNPDFVAAPKISPITGTYYEAQEVTITASEGATIYYTTDGGDPRQSNAVYAAPFTVRETTTVKAVAVKGDNMSEIAESVITIETLQTQTIAQVIKAGAVDAASTTGAVNAVCQSGFLLGDATGYIFVYTGSVPDVAVGDAIAVSGKVSAYGGCMQFSNVSITKKGTETITYPDATVLDGAAFDALVAAPVVTFVEVSGKVTSVGNYNNFTIENATATGSILATSEVLGDIAVGNIVKVTGFFIYKSGSKTIYGNIIATKVEIVGGQTEEVELATLAEAKEKATAENAAVKLIFKEALVTFVNGSSVYLSDGTDGLLIYGENSASLKAGDVITGSIKGQLCLYNGLTEIASPTYDVTVLSEGNEVVVQEVTADELVKNTGDYESELVIVKGIVPTAEVWESRNVVMTYSDDNDVDWDITVRDNWKVATNLSFNTSAAYEVTGFPSRYTTDGKTIVQLYPRTADDIVNTTEAGLQTPESAWSVASVETTVDGTVEATFTTTSDGAITYSSSNESVATVDAEGKITIVGSGRVVITAETAQTNKFKASKAELTIVVKSNHVLQGDGTLENPYTVADLLSFDAQSTQEAVANDVWVKAVIVGYINGSTLNENTAMFSADAPEGVDKEGNPLTVTASNILVADAADATDIAAVAPIQLKNNSAARSDLNLADNADKLHATVCIKGDIFKYMGTTGLKNVAEYSLGAKGDVNGDGNVDLTDAIMIVYYSLGAEPVGFNEAAADVNSDGNIDLTDAIEVVYSSLGQNN